MGQEARVLLRDFLDSVLWYRHQDGRWLYNLWQLQAKRLLLTAMETARVLSLNEGRRGGGCSSSRSRSRSRDRQELGLDRLQVLLFHQDLLDRDS